MHDASYSWIDVIALKRQASGMSQQIESYPAQTSRWILADSRIMDTITLTANGEFHTTGVHDAVNKNLTPLSAAAIAFKNVTG
jgi:hypothetical protein